MPLARAAAPGRARVYAEHRDAFGLVILQQVPVVAGELDDEALGPRPRSLMRAATFAAEWRSSVSVNDEK
jgi:hypothetical protein